MASAGGARDKSSNFLLWREDVLDVGDAGDGSSMFTDSMMC